jgi:hypothetical protein
MTDRDAYWGAKVVTSFTDAQLTAVVDAAQLDADDAAYVARALRVRRDVIGRRYLTAMTAVEAPAVVVVAGVPSVCFDDLAIARGYAEAPRVRYHVQIADDRGRRLVDGMAAAQGARTCVAAPAIAGGYRVMAIGAELAGEDGTWRAAKVSRIHVAGGHVVGLERDE